SFEGGRTNAAALRKRPNEPNKRPQRSSGWLLSRIGCSVAPGDLRSGSRAASRDPRPTEDPRRSLKIERTNPARPFEKRPNEPSVRQCRQGGSTIRQGTGAPDSADRAPPATQEAEGRDSLAGRIGCKIKSLLEVVRTAGPREPVCQIEAEWVSASR